MATVLLVGGSGLIGGRLKKRLVKLGFNVIILTRKDRKSDEQQVQYLKWDPKNQMFPPGALQVNHVVNLAGAGIADKRWTDARKKILRNSRVKLTDFVFEKFASSPIRLDSYIGASAIGIYGNSLEKLCSETDVAEFPSFMSILCEEWEGQHHRFREISQKVSITRFGIVLSKKGGAFKKMYYPALLTRVANYFGDGMQHYSWIHIDDAVEVIMQMLQGTMQEGTYNIVTPKPIRNKEFAKTLAKAVFGPVMVVGIPKSVVKNMFGEMSKTILNSNKVSAKKLTNRNFEYKFSDLKLAMKDLIKKNN